MNTNTGNYIALAGLIVSALGYFHVIVDQNTIITIIAGCVSAYGLIHQFIVTKKLKKIATEAGVKGLK